MNYRLVSKYLGHFSIAIALLMLPSLLWALHYGEWRSSRGLGGSMLIAAALGGALSLLGRKARPQFFQREALALVGIGWVMASGLGAIPFVAAGALGPVDAFFESASGFTTTGASVINDVDGTEKGLLFWRSFTHWLGGMGIIVLFIAVLPYLGAGGKQLFRSESPGPDPRGLRPRIKSTASILWRIYLTFTVAMTVMLVLAGMNLFDALCHTFGALGTGGFSTRTMSIAAYDSLLIEIIIIVFMVLAGSNFSLFFAMYKGDWTALFKSIEWKVYVGILVAATLVISLNLLGAQGDAGMASSQAQVPYATGRAIRDAAFQVSSVMTTTGYITADFDAWPHASKMILFLLMFVGGCAGSTGGGMKVVRVVMLAKMAYWRIESTFRPKTIRPIRLDKTVVDEETVKSVYGFFVLYLGVFAVAALALSLLGLPFQSALTAVAATLNNVGPGLEFVGPIENFAAVPAMGKIILSLCMIMGRLELYTICVLFLPSFWWRRY